MIASEIAPFAKVGGLADVVGSLPKALAGLGHEIRIVCPLYGCIESLGDRTKYHAPLQIRLGEGNVRAMVWETRLPGSLVELYLIEHEEAFGGTEIYRGASEGSLGDDQRFGLLCRASLDLCYFLDWIPDVIHCHDWPAALVPLMLNTTEAGEPLARAATVLTIHSLQYQGQFSPGIIGFVKLPKEVFRADCLEFMGGVNLLKGGIYNATKVTTVSPTYSREVLEEGGGFGLEDALRFRSADLIGILNGIDLEEWNPATDTLIRVNFTCEEFDGKWECKRALQREFGLKVDPEMILLGVVSRLFWEKGLDLLVALIPTLVKDLGVQLVALGQGDVEIEGCFREMSERFSGSVGARIAFSNELAHRIVAGADAFIMPSRFEPCGLSQLYAMAYGTPPIVRATGGLVDTVEDYDETRARGTGFVFKEPKADELMACIRRAVQLYEKSPSDFHDLRIRGMKVDSSWEKSARKYSDVYRWAVEARQ